MSFFDFLQSTRPDATEPVYYTPLREQRFDVAIPQLKRAIAQDDGHAMGIYASLIALGRGVERDPSEAALWFRQSAARGDAYGQLAFAMCLIIGFGLPADLGHAAYWLYQSGTAGNRKAKEVLRDLVDEHPELVGGHFTTAQYLGLVGAMPRPESIH
jgi:TPR repeat protein